GSGAPRVVRFVPTRRASDLMIASDYPNEEYWKWTGSQGVGSYNGGATKKRQFFRVPTSYYRGKDILSAEFAVTVAYNWYNDNHADRKSTRLNSSHVKKTYAD